jgi:hypothetical protein
MTLHGTAGLRGVIALIVPSGLRKFQAIVDRRLPPSGAFIRTTFWASRGATRNRCTALRTFVGRRWPSAHLESSNRGNAEILVPRESPGGDEKRRQWNG